MEPFAYNLFAAFFEKFNDFMAAIFPQLSEPLNHLVTAFVTLYIIVISIAIMCTKLGGKEKEFFISMILLAGLKLFLFDFDVYNYWVIGPLIGSVLDLSGFFINIVNTTNQNNYGGSGLSALFNALDALSFKLFDFVTKIEVKGNFIWNAWTYMQTGTGVLILFASYAAAYVAFLAMMIMGVFSMYVFFAVGGICIFFAAFKETRFIFFAWLKGVSNYALLVVFASIIMSICYFGLSETIDKLIQKEGHNIIFTSQYLGAVCWSLLTIGMLLKAPDFASQLTGAVAGSTSGIAAGMSLSGSSGAMMLGNAATAGGSAGWTGIKKGGQIASGGTRAFSRMMGLPEDMM